MPEKITNPFREEPTGLNPDSSEFFKEFVPDYEPDQSPQPDQAKQAPAPEPADEHLDLTATAEEKEQFDNETVECAGIEITRKEERQINEIIKNLNKERQQNGLEKVELGKEINLHKIEIGGKSKAQLEKALKQASIQTTDRTQFMLNSKDFTTQEHQEQNILIRLTIADLGLPQGATTEEIFNKAIELGMELCPPETGPQWRLQYQDQPMNEWILVGMKQITDSDGYPDVFRLARSSAGLWLLGYWARQADRWYLGNSFVFRPASLRSPLRSHPPHKTTE